MKYLNRKDRFNSIYFNMFRCRYSYWDENFGICVGWRNKK